MIKYPYGPASVTATAITPATGTAPATHRDAALVRIMSGCLPRMSEAAAGL